MNIVHISNCLRGGGIQNFLISLLPEQSQKGNDVSLIVIERFGETYCEKLAKKLNDKGIKVICLNKEQANKLSAFKSLIKCRRIIKKLSPDIINTHGELSHIFGAFSSLFSSYIHCCTIHNAPERWNKITKIINRDKPLIFCSETALLIRDQQSKEMIAINNGVDVNVVRTVNKVDLRKELGLQIEDKLVVLVGSQRPQKNYPFLIKIVEELNNPHIHFCICGGNYKLVNGKGNSLDYISTDEFARYNNIHLLGLRSDVPGILSTSDVYLSCSLREGLPISALESFFNGIPCVLSPIPQHTAIIEGIEACFIPKEFNSTSFISAIYEAINYNKTHEQLMRLREDALQKFTIQVCAQKYLNYYNTLIEQVYAKK